MTERVKIADDGSQTDRLPDACAVGNDQQDGVVEPRDEWSDEFLKMLGTWDEPIERPGSR
jgi:hypothetical protein